MIHITFFAALLAAASFFALLEIQIEGADGWAAGLPTWRIENRWTAILLGSRPLTGYHLHIHLFVLVTLHLPYALGFAPPSLVGEARIIAFLILFWIAEDFLWFLFNPEFGIRRFAREHIWWHAPAWWWIMPREYWIFTPIGVVLYLWSWA